MIRSLYLSGTNMIVQRRRMDVVTNNLVNVETAGYKTDNLLSRSFEDLMLSRVGDPAILSQREEVGPLNTGVHIDEIITDFTQGPLMGTDKSTDVALASDGFFVIQTPDGERYTRDGSFHVDSTGLLLTSDGNRVMGVDGEIVIENAAEGFIIDTNGYVVNINNEAVARLRVVDFEDKSGLRKTGDNLFYDYNNQGVTELETFDIRSGFLEGSNAQSSIEMVNMLRLYRSYETSQRMVKMVDSTLQKTVNDVGRV